MKSLTAQSNHKSVKSSEKDRSRRDSAARDGKQPASKPTEEKISAQYGPISRRLNSVTTPVSFEKFKMLHDQ